MTKNELIDHVKYNAMPGATKKQVGEAVQGVFDALADALQRDGRISYPGFGTFNVKARAERQGRNPRTGDPITIPASKAVGFKAAPSLKDAL